MENQMETYRISIKKVAKRNISFTGSHMDVEASDIAEARKAVETILARQYGSDAFEITAAREVIASDYSRTKA